MSDIVRIPSDLTIVVCDAKKALFLKNAGPAAQPDLQIDETIENEVDEAGAGVAAPPGRRFDGGAAAMAGGARSAMEFPDTERKRNEEFAETIVAALVRRHAAGDFRSLVLVAPPAFLGGLRRKMNHDLEKLVRAEIPKELAEMPLPDIRKVLLGSL